MSQVSSLNSSGASDGFQHCTECVRQDLPISTASRACPYGRRVQGAARWTLVSKELDRYVLSDAVAWILRGRQLFIVS